MTCLYGSQVGDIWVWHPPLSSVCPRWLCCPFRTVIETLSLVVLVYLQISFLLGASRGILLFINLVFSLAPTSSRLGHVVSLSRSLYRSVLPRQECFLAGSFPSLHVMNGFLEFCLTCSFAVYLQYFFSWFDDWWVMRLWPVQQFIQNCSSISSTGKYITIVFVDLPICELDRSC